MKKSTEFELNFPSIKLTAYSRLIRDQAKKYDSHLWRHNDEGGKLRVTSSNPRVTSSIHELLVQVHDLQD